ncbi:MAG: hypothetical protein Q3960_02290 [Lactobacillus sp.]|nr:hypothetical protein [Lactobacillus sp.]
MPIIKEESGGFESKKLITKTFKVKKVAKNSDLDSYFKNGELVAPKKLYDQIVSLMFTGRKDVVGIDKIFVTVDSIKHIKTIDKYLTDKGYNTTNAFKYYDDLDTNVGKIVNFSLVVLAILLLLAICFLAGLFELMLRNAVGDIAVLKHLGFDQKSITKIYLLPMRDRILISLCIIVLCNLALYKFGLIHSLSQLGIFECISILLCVIIFLILYMRIRHYAKKELLSLIKFYKVEE